ncbi:MAG TPA: cytidylate kinase-like family protein [Draconibacterium sp.]|nr:cytidylate kinase-like family protein [Draconibacterium sp.]
MGNSLMNYLNKRLKEEKSFKKDSTSMAGPVITISREVGCNGLKLAHLIAKRLNEQKPATDWKVLSKEVFHQSAKALNLEPERVRRIFKQTDKYTFDEILKAFSDRQFKSERRIIKTVSEVVRSFAVDGFAIIVGRAGHIIANDIECALHIRLVAPLEYRIKTIMENNRLNREEAIAFIRKVENERIVFRKAISKTKFNEEMFDLTINRAYFSDEEAVDIIEYAVNKKKILADFKPKIEYY